MNASIAASLTDTALPKARLRITRRGRAVVTALIAVPVVALSLVVALNGGGAFAATESSNARTAPAPFDYVTVPAGASLWQLAETMAPNADPRDVIADIVSLNQLDTASVYPGQELAIPVAYSN